MNGRRTLKFVLGMLRILGFLRVHPFQWDEKEYRILTTSRKTSIFGFFSINRLGLKLSMTLIIANTIFGYFRIIQSLTAKSHSFQEIMFQCFVLGFQSLNTLITVNNIRSLEDMPAMFSMFIQYERQLTARFQLRPVKDEALAYAMFFGSVAIAEIPGMTILYLANMKMPVYLGSLRYLVPGSYTMSRLFLFLVFLIIEIYLSISAILNSILYGFWYILVLQAGNFWTRQLIPTTPRHWFTKQEKNSTECKMTHTSYKDFSNMVHVYRSWLYMFRTMQTIANTNIVGQHFGSSLFLVICTFSTIRFWGWHNFESIQTFVSYGVFPTAMAMFFTWIILTQPLAANSLNGSVSLRFGWKKQMLVENSETRLEIRKVLRSFENLSMSVSFFKYKASTMPQVLDECIDRTIELLVTSKNS